MEKGTRTHCHFIKKVMTNMKKFVSAATRSLMTLCLLFPPEIFLTKRECDFALKISLLGLFSILKDFADQADAPFAQEAKIFPWKFDRRVPGTCEKVLESLKNRNFMCSCSKTFECFNCSYV